MDPDPQPGSDPPPVPPEEPQAESQQTPKSENKENEMHQAEDKIAVDAPAPEPAPKSFSSPRPRAASLPRPIPRPPLPVNDYLVGSRLLQLLVIVWLLSGCSFLTCITLCIVVNVGYVAFRSTGNVLPLVFAFTFLSWILFKFYWTLIWTAIRLGIRIWKQKFGAGEQDFYPLRWVDSMGRRIVGWRWVPRNRVGTGSESIVEDKQKASASNEKLLRVVKQVILALLILVLLGVPLLTIAAFYGYWSVIAFMCAALTFASSACIMLTNIGKRLQRFFVFESNLWLMVPDRTVPPRLRAAYLASFGRDTAKNMVDQISDYGMRLSIIVFLCSLIFNAFQPQTPTIIMILSFFGFFLLLRCRRLFCCGYKKTMKEFQREEEQLEELQMNTVVPELDLVPSPHTAKTTLSRRSVTMSRWYGPVVGVVEKLEYDDYYRGKHWSNVITLFILRVFVFLGAFISLIYLDLSAVTSPDGNPPIEMSVNDTAARSLIMWTCFFYISTIGKDICFLVPIPWKYARPLLIGFFQCAQIIFAVFGRLYFSGFTFFAAIILTALELDYREARYFWSNMQPRGLVSIGQRRARRYTCLIIIICILIVLSALFLGMIVGTKNDTEAAVQARVNPQSIFTNAPVVSGFIPAMCAITVSANQLTLVDLATFSNAVYKGTKSEALEYIELNPHLRNKSWTLGIFNLERGDQDYKSDDSVVTSDPNVVNGVSVSTGLRFAEFINTDSGVSVIAVRGTYKLEDIFQDMYLWSTVAFLQMSSYFGTFVNAWPVDIVARTVYFITTYASYPNLIYWAEMENIVKGIVAKKPPGSASGTSTFRQATVVLTGHSLGAGLASIVASHQALPSFVFSSPGLGYSVYNYNLTMPSVMQRMANVIPMSDPVAQFDYQLGTEFHIPCDAGSPGDCHSIDRTLNTLVQICGASS